MWNFERCEQEVKRARDSWKGTRIANNTVVREIDANIMAIKLHGTDVVRYMRDGTVILNTGGWNTLTNRGRMRHFGPSWLRFFSSSTIKFEQKLRFYDQDGQHYPWPENGLVIPPDRIITGLVDRHYIDNPATRKARAALRAAIRSKVGTRIMLGEFDNILLEPDSTLVPPESGMVCRVTFGCSWERHHHDTALALIAPDANVAEILEGMTTSSSGTTLPRTKAYNYLIEDLIAECVPKDRLAVTTTYDPVQV